jgi:RraA family protein
VDPATVEALCALQVSLLSDNMARLSGSHGLIAYHRPRTIAGTAVTVHTRAGDNLVIHRAFDYCRPGDVLVIDGGGDVAQSLLGEIMATYAKSIGIACLVVDGAIRDVAGIRALDLPCYARAATHRGPYKSGPGEINVPVAVGGMPVSPGDVIVGDEDGLLAIPPDEVAALIEKARVQQKTERETVQAILERRYDRTWLDALERKAMG